MHISVVGISHKTAPVEVREHFAFAADELPPLLARLGERFPGAAVLSTCNRTEVYVASPRGVGDPRPIEALLSEIKGEPPIEGAPFFSLAGKDAARHLFRVASGIESMVIGESEILGQVRVAFAAATTAGTNAPALSRLFHSAIRVGRKARSKTNIGRGAMSVSSTAVAVARQALGDLEGKTALVVSAGEAGKLTARTLAGSGVSQMLVTSRNEERASELAAELGGRTVLFKELAAAVAASDIVITSTASHQFIIDAPLVAGVMHRRQARPLLLIDIAVPRDVDPAVSEIPGVHLHDIDALQAIARENMHLRRNELARAEEIVEDEVQKFGDWLRSLEVVPTVAALRAQAEAVRLAELERTLGKTKLTPADRKRIEAMTAAIVKKLLHEPVRRLKASGDGERYVEPARALFGLDEDQP